jgi:hypothetical protein
VERDSTDRFGTLLALLVASFLFAGVHGSDVFRVLASVANGLALVVALRSTGDARSTSRMAVVIAVAVTAVIAESFSRNDDVPGGLAALLQVAILVVMTVAILRRLALHQRVGVQTLLGALCVYFLLGLMFGWTYAAVDAIDGNPVFVSDIDRPDPIYYSFIVMTTVGFGDVTPATDLMGRITVIQAMAGQIFLATMIARLMSLFGRER